MEKLSENRSEKDVLPRLEMAELKKRHLLDDHSWAYIYGLKSDFVDFCMRAKPQDEIRVEATFVDELSVGLEYSDPPHSPENPKWPDRGNPSLTTMLDLELIDTSDNLDQSLTYTFIVKNMDGLPLTHYRYKDGNEWVWVALDPPEKTLAILHAFVVKGDSEADLVWVRKDQSDEVRKNPNLPTV